MDFKKEVKQVISELQSADNKISSSSGLYRALIMMRTTLIKSKDALAQLLQAGCVKMLLDLLILVPPTTKGKWLKTMDIILSILANLCLEEDVRDQVISSKGLSIIVEATVSTEMESIHNRGVRAVANLVQHIPQCDELFDLEFPAFVAKRLMETKEKECKLTYLRAVRLFGQTNGQVKKLIEGSRSIQAVASMLEETDEKFKLRALRILSECSALRCCPAFVEQILAANVLEELVQATEDPNCDISFFSLSIIFKLCEYENIRPPLGAAGLISTFMRLLDQEKSHINHVSILNALCLCSKEAVNRHKLYQENTLELFVSALQSGHDYTSGKFSVLHDRIVSILIHFIYNDECFVKLLDLGLVSVLMDHLERACNFKVLEDDWSNQMLFLSEGIDKGTDELGVSDRYGENDNRNEMIVEEICDNKGFDNDKNVDKTVGTLTDNRSLSRSFDSHEVTGDKNVNADDTELKDFDQEIVNIEDTPSLGAGSRHIFSIDSPTYQLEQHSWRLEDHTSGVTCKTFTPVHFEDHFNPKPMTESGKLSPYSPLSAGASYYSPAYSSPANSLGMSPRNYGFQSSGSYNLGSQSPQSSPTWSLASSSHLEDSSSDQGMSPGNLGHTQTSHQGQFSPLINPYPASPPVIAVEERDIYASPLFNSQLSIVSNKSLYSQEDIFSESPKPLVSTVTPHQSTSTRPAFAHVTLSGENQDPIYSASEEEAEVEEQSAENCVEKKEQENLLKFEAQWKEKKQISDGSNSKDINVSKKKSGKEKLFNVRPEASSIESYEAFTDNSSMSSVKFIPTQTTDVPFIRLNSDPCISTRSPGNAENDGKKDNCNVLPFAMKSSVEEAVSAKAQRERIWNKTFSANTTKPFSFLGSSSFPLLSPFRRQSEFGPQSPSMSPFSRYSNSPYTSPNPYQQKGDKSSSLGSEDFNKGVIKSNGSFQKVISSTIASNNALPFVNTASTTTAQPSVNTSSTASNEPSSADSIPNNERVKKILRTTESNILILLSRISLKTNPTPYLVKFSILSTLTSYLGISPRPFQRAIRTLSRLCNNPLCFEFLLLEQAPALIVKNLILDQDGSFPSVLFKDHQGDRLFGANVIRKIDFDEMFSSSQSSDTVSDFGLKMEFEFGSDAYSRIMSSPCHFPARIMNRSLSIDSQCARDNPEIYNTDICHNVEDRIKQRVGMGISLMKVLTSLALSRYGDGEIQRLLFRGSKSDRLACAISLLHMTLGCGPLHRRQIAFKHDTLLEVLPVLFYDGAPLVRESLVTALCLLAHLLGITKRTPTISKIKPCPDSNSGAPFPSSSTHDCDCIDQCDNNCRMDEEDRSSGSRCSSKTCAHSYHADGKSGKEMKSSIVSCGIKGEKDEKKKMKDEILCVYEYISDKHNLNLIVTDDRSGEKKVLRACKEILMRKSDVFSAMLGGGYAEADKVDIEFSDVGLSGFEYIIHYLHGCKSGCGVIDSVMPHVANLPYDSSSSSRNRSENSKNDIMQKKSLNNPQSNPKSHEETSHEEEKACVLGGEVKQNLCEKGNSLQHTEPQERSCENSISIGCENRVQTSTQTSGQIQNDPLVSPSLSTKSLKHDNSVKHDNSGVDSMNISPLTLNANDDNDDPLTKHILSSSLEKCIDILTVADRFLLHDLAKHMTSLLSHHYLCPSTSQEILYLASYYKLDNLASDCVLEVLLSQMSRKDVAHLFVNLGLDNGMKETVLNILMQLFTKD